MKLKADVSLEEIDPVRASELLANLWGEQRGVREGHVAKLAADMRNGKFRLSPDAILIINDQLANGQHRLRAVVDSDRTQSFIVMRSIDNELFKILDCGLKRSASDALVNRPYHKILPTIARWVIAHDSGRVGIRQSWSSGNEACADRPSQVQIIDYCLEHVDELTEAAAFIAPLYEQTQLLRCSVGGAIYVIGKRLDQDHSKINEFLRAVYVGGLPKTSAEDLRNSLIRNKHSRAKKSPGYFFLLAMKAFKLFLADKKPAKLRLKPDRMSII